MKRNGDSESPMTPFTTEDADIMVTEMENSESNTDHSSGSVIECDAETMEYTECGSPHVTCSTVHKFETFTQCIAMCQCKENYPIHDAVNDRCITMDHCPGYHHISGRSSESSEGSIVATPSPIFPLLYNGSCAEHCVVYFNGCNACQCPAGGDEGVDLCTNRDCAPGVEGGSDRQCVRCEVAEMEYTLCGKCDRTCADPSPFCLQDSGCTEKCQCPLERPIYDEGTCITVEECAVSSSGQFAVLANDRLSFVDELRGKPSIPNWMQTNVPGQYVVVALILVLAGLLMCLAPRYLKQWKRQFNDANGDILP